MPSHNPVNVNACLEGARGWGGITAERLCQSVLPGERTWLPFEEGILHLWIARTRIPRPGWHITYPVMFLGRMGNQEKWGEMGGERGEMGENGGKVGLMKLGWETWEKFGQKVCHPQRNYKHHEQLRAQYLWAASSYHQNGSSARRASLQVPTFLCP